MKKVIVFLIFGMALGCLDQTPKEADKAPTGGYINGHSNNNQQMQGNWTMNHTLNINNSRFGGGMPAEAVNACMGKSSGEECSLYPNQRNISGACMGDENLTCRPIIRQR